MQIHLSFDYELFFGSSSGSLAKCIIEPTNKLIILAKKHDVKFIFFVDAGYLVQLKKHSHIPQCKIDYEKVSAQILELHHLGHEIALHIHPHWEDCTFENNQWKINTTRYKLANFNASEVEKIITSYHQVLINITQTPCKSYRAGGWCIQPFANIKSALEKNNILIDSSIYYNGYHDSVAHSYDFRSAPNKTEWNFDTNPCVEAIDGKFTEIAITPDVIPSWFYWKLYFNMKTNPAKYKPIGDGNWLVDKKRIYKHFYSSTNHFACADGFFASRLNAILNKCKKQGKARMMVLSHPKSLAECSFEALDEFISNAKAKGFNVVGF